MLRSTASTLLVAAIGLLQACGGGGSGDFAPRTGAPSASLSVSPETVSASATTSDAYPQAAVYLSVDNPPDSGLYVGFEHTSNAVSTVDFSPTGAATAEAIIYFKAGLPAGTYSDQVIIHVCLDDRCAREIGNSPFTLPVTLTVTQGSGGTGGGPPPTPQPEAGIDALPIANQHALGHDVIDAEYSSALDAIVMVSSYPSNALYVLSATDGTEQSVPLDKPPSSVSVAPDGLSAAVGHDALITVIDLTRLADPVGAKTLLNVSIPVLDVVLAGNGYVHAFPTRDQWSNIHTVQISTNTETLNAGGQIYAGTRAKLGASGTKMYGSGNRLEHYAINGGTVTYDYDDFSNYSPCANLWMQENGPLVYSACGTVYETSDNKKQDMRYAGTLALSKDSIAQPFRIVALSQSAERHEIALLEESSYSCGSSPGSSCYTHLGIYESDYDDLVARYSLAPVTVAGADYSQRGVFVFHTADGSRRFLISRLAGLEGTADGFQIGEVQVAGHPAPGPNPPPPPAPTVNASTESGIPAAPLTDIHALPHDIVDAEYSPALDSIVMASSYPSNAVYVRDMSTGNETAIALARPATAVSVSPDGKHIAVGHDSYVSYIDLSQSGPVAPAPVLLSTTIPVLDVVLGGNGYVYTFPLVDQWESIHSVNLATHAETTSTGTIYAGTLARLHPSGTKMYGATNGLSPDNVERYSTTGGTAQYAYASPYWGDYPICGNLWFSEDGHLIYTACGNTFRSSDVQSQDMVYAGALTLSTDQYRGYRILSADDSAEASEVAIVEQSWYECQPYVSSTSCSSHVNLYGNTYLTRNARYSLSPFTVGADTYAQRGQFVFHSSDGSKRYVLSQLYGMPNAKAEYYVSRLP